MDEDLKTTGNCHYYMMKDAFLRLSAFTPLRKNSPYTETMSIGYNSLKLKSFCFNNQYRIGFFFLEFYESIRLD